MTMIDYESEADDGKEKGRNHDSYILISICKSHAKHHPELSDLELCLVIHRHNHLSPKSSPCMMMSNPFVGSIYTQPYCRNKS